MPGNNHLLRGEVAARQLEALRSLVAELFPGNSFYTKKFNAAGLTFDIASLEDFSARFPFTTKIELAEDQRLVPPFGTNLTYPINCYTRFHQTSGTAGHPLRWLDTPESWENMIESWVEIFRAAGVARGDRVYFAFSFGPFIGFWLAFEAAERLGCLCLPGGGLSSVNRARAMVENVANVVCCTPTYALHLAEVAAREGIALRSGQVRTLIVAGEPGGSLPALRARLTEMWGGARVFDHHGMTEVGPVTYECPARPGVLHVLEPAFFAEIVQPASGAPVGPGQIGELVLTTLVRPGSPVLRYRTGDLVRLAMPGGTPEVPCACGRSALALEGGILGRTDDMVVVRGVNVYPSAVEEIVRAFDGVAEYRAQVSTANALAELSLEVEPSPDCADTSALARRLAQALLAALALRVPITIVPAGTLPRFEMKARRWLKP